MSKNFLSQKKKWFLILGYLKKKKCYHLRNRFRTYVQYLGHYHKIGKRVTISGNVILRSF